MKPLNVRALIVDDEKTVRRILTQNMVDAGYLVDCASTVAEARSYLEKGLPDIVLLDYQLPDGVGIDVLKFIKNLSPNLPVVMITAYATLSGAVQAVKEGAYDYIAKPFEEEELLQTVQRALETSRLREQITYHQAEEQKSFGAHNIVARSAAMKKVLNVIHRVAESGATTVLLLGESGVGKGLVAKALHHLEGKNVQRPFMNVTCTALTETLLESELFGHEKGAFTDARTEKKGLFELAQGGTVFLDEIGDISASLQTKLLRFLEDKTFRRVGGNRDIQVAVRIVAATNKDLRKEVEAGRFRSDLFFRMNVIAIEIPPLRERKEDIFPLAEQFIGSLNREFNKKILDIEEEVKECMLQYAWPGNVRELRNTLERAVLLSRRETIALEDLPGGMLGGAGNFAVTLDSSNPFQLPQAGLVLETLEKDFILQALKRTDGNHVHAAKLLGMNRHQIRYRIDKFNLGKMAYANKDA